MTRITNFGRKRTHVEATFSHNETDLEGPDAESQQGEAADKSTVAVTNIEGVDTTEDGRDSNGQPPKKKRKRGPRKKAGAKVTTGIIDGGESGEGGAVDGEGGEKKSNGTPSKKGKKGKVKSRNLQGSSPL